MFFTGIIETQNPYAFLVSQGIDDLLHVGKNKIVETVPQLILPIKRITFPIFINCTNL